MSFGFKYETHRGAVPVYPGASTVGGMITSTCVGYLCVAGSTVASVGQYGEIPINSTADMMKVKGIICDVPTNTTCGSTVPFYVYPIFPGDILTANYSTTVERSTGATSVIVSTNRGYFIGLGNSTDTILGRYVDPSLASTAPGTTNCMLFRLIDLSTQNDTVDVMVNSTHIAW
jgi:hypothetical protein